MGRLRNSREGGRQGRLTRHFKAGLTDLELVLRITGRHKLNRYNPHRPDYRRAHGLTPETPPDKVRALADSLRGAA